MEQQQQQQTPERVLVVGATGGSGRATIDALLEAGHEVTAFSRRTESLEARPGLRRISGDATKQADVDAAVQGQDAVVITLGISENPLRVRLLGSRGTPMDVRSTGTRRVIEAMKRHGVKRLVVLSSYGAGATRRGLRLRDRVLFRLLIQPQMQDTEAQEQLVQASDREWVIAQPVYLTDTDTREQPFLSHDGATRAWKVSRRQVGAFLADAVRVPEHVGRNVAVSG